MIRVAGALVVFVYGPINHWRRGRSLYARESSSDTMSRANKNESKIIK